MPEFEGTVLYASANKAGYNIFYWQDGRPGKREKITIPAAQARNAIVIDDAAESPIRVTMSDELKLVGVEISGISVLKPDENIRSAVILEVRRVLRSQNLGQS